MCTDRRLLLAVCASQMSAANTDLVGVAALILESAIVVTAAQALECLARLAAACMPEQSCVLPFLPVRSKDCASCRMEWSFHCSQACRSAA
jgi:hypothetical protein